jgi:hypothetical protein
MAKQVYKFKKGQLIHLDDVYDIQAFVLPYCTPYRNPDLYKWNPDTSDDYKVNADFTVTIIVGGTPTAVPVV